MRAPATFRARDPHAAHRTAVLVLLVCAATLVVFSLFGPNAESTAGMVSSWVTSVLLALLAVVYRTTPADRLDRRGGYLLIAVLGVVLCCGMNWITRDPSAGAQAFLAFPVLWAGVNLHRDAVALVTAVALGLDATVLFHLEPAGDAVSDLSFFGAVLVAMAAFPWPPPARQPRRGAILPPQPPGAPPP